MYYSPPNFVHLEHIYQPSRAQMWDTMCEKVQNKRERERDRKIVHAGNLKCIGIHAFSVNNSLYNLTHILLYFWM